MSESQQKKLKLWEFLMTTPPGKELQIDDLIDNNEIQKPSIILYCDDEMCRADMYFDCKEKYGRTNTAEWRPCELLYRCRHCGTSSKWFSLLVCQGGYGWRSGKVKKLGECPPFGPHTPARVISLVGPDKELFLKGRQSEARGLGIGAFTYYRRVVDNNWQRLLDEAIKVATKLDLPTEVLEKAKGESQFSQAVEMIKDGIPQVLLIDGKHNPMTLLYKTLSTGIHNLTDEQCLELAKHIRVVLVDFTERVGEALRERKELQDSLTKLFQLGKPQALPEDTDSQKDDNQDTQQEKL